MAQIFDGGIQTFDAMVYGMPHPGTITYLASQVHQPTTALTTSGQAFFQDAQEMFDRYNGSDALRLIAAVNRGDQSSWLKNNIRYMHTVDDLQQAPVAMQRWIMAEPTVRKMYLRNQIDGFSDSYVNLQGDGIGPNHYDWRRATDGLIEIDETPYDEGEYGWHSTTYYEDLLPDDRDLTLQEQVDIRDTWGAIRKLIKSGERDPTSRYDTDLG